MKKYNKLISLMVALFVVGACDDKLELSDPERVGPSIVFSSDANVKSALLDAYDGLSSGSLFGGNTLRNSELLGSGGEVNWSGTFNDPLDIFNKQMTTINAEAANTWIAAYDAINAANNILASLSVVNEEDRDQVKGEALFVRGIALFELVRLYGKPYSAGNTATNLAVPIMLEEDRNSVAQVSRATVEEVYQQVLSDLGTAEGLLNEGRNNNKASRGAVAAILSRVHLQMGSYQSARDAANRVITSGNYSLNASYAACFNGVTTNEDIFDIPVSNADGTNSMVTFFAATSAGGRGDIQILDSHLNLYDTDDNRLSLFYADPSNGRMRSGKWLNPNGYVKIIRLAEMYLTRAECNFRLGTSTGDTPLNDVNQVHTRAGLTALGSVDLAAILLERRLELAHEGHRIHDTKRLQGTVIEGTNTYPYDHDLLVYPIPQRERNVNSNLTQNSGYF
ncbi:MAG: RagB/SusD family nutrient uptake outer membrane protein [Cyclobacteriaceae bacterium]|nr:RagB/SusD family nutrient uptake outer membrane protein [Cyclobacteriaceae bacterium]